MKIFACRGVISVQHFQIRSSFSSFSKEKSVAERTWSSAKLFVLKYYC